MLRAEYQSARMSKITNDGLTRSATGYFIAVPVTQQWVQRVKAVPLHFSYLFSYLLN